MGGKLFRGHGSINHEVKAGGAKKLVKGARERALKQSKNNSYGSFKEAFIKAFNSLIENKEKKL